LAEVSVSWYSRHCFVCLLICWNNIFGFRQDCGTEANHIKIYNVTVRKH